MTWTEPRPTAPELDLVGDERHMLRQFLRFYRGALLDRAWGLTREQLQQTLPPSTLSLGRLISHMAYVEEIWFRVRFDGEEPDFIVTLDFESDSDAEMTHSETLSVAELLELYNNAVADSDRREAAAASLDQVSKATHPKFDKPWNLRWIMIHMIEEYARHCGHADLIRESIDGDTAS